MIQALRNRFIRNAMFAVFLVLVAIMATINVLNFRNITNEADVILSILSEHQDSLQALHAAGGPPPQDAEAMATGDPYGEGSSEKEADIRKVHDDWSEWSQELSIWNDTYGRPGFSRVNLSKETPFESRYLFLVVDPEGNILESDITHIVSIEEEDLQDYAAAAMQTTKTNGFFRQFRFQKTVSDDQIRILFLDCSRSFQNFRSFLKVSFIVSGFSLVAILLLLFPLSARAIQPAKESYEKQRRFIADAGHELKTPLTIIDADITVAEMESGNNEWLDDIKQQTKRLSDLTNDLIYLSRMDEGTESVQYIDFSFSDLVADTVQSFRSRVQLEDKVLQTEIEPMLTYCGDENSMRKLVSILLDNAIKYSDPHGQISLVLKKKNKTLILAVENPCADLQKETISHFFDRFYRGDASRNSTQKGYGIGLSLARAIVTAHKGTIEATLPQEKVLRIQVHLSL